MTDCAPLTLPSRTLVSATGRLIDAIGTDRFSVALRSCLALCCKFESMIVFAYVGARSPVAIYHDLDELRAATSVDYYATGPYLLDPLYRACRDGVDAGAYRTRELAPAAFFRSEYYRAFFRKLKISDEIGLLIPDRNDSWIVVSLARSARSPEFDDTDTRLLNEMFGIISSAIRKQWGKSAEIPEGSFERGWEDIMKTFGTGVLSSRECEVVQLVLLGHSTLSAASALGIAEGTVKAHRHSAYSKLGISSQAELFSMATRHLAGGR